MYFHVFSSPVPVYGSDVLIPAQHSDFRSCFSPGEVEMKEKVLPPFSVQLSSRVSLLQIHSSFLEEISIGEDDKVNISHVDRPLKHKLPD